jgi:hypothetical protein
MRDNGVTNRGARALAAALWCSMTVTQIDLTNNSIEDEGCTAFAECVQHSCTNVSSICLELNPGSTGVHACVCMYMLSAFCTYVCVFYVSSILPGVESWIYMYSYYVCCMYVYTRTYMYTYVHIRIYTHLTHIDT